jgi:phosphonatase-like hydrolase
MSIKLVVFDIAGTTVSDDNHVAKAFQKAFAENGIAISIEEANPLMGYHKPLAIQMKLEEKGVEFDEEFIDKIHSDFEDAMIDFYEYSPEVKAVAGAEDVFEKLKERGIRIALNTGFSKVIADTIVERLQWKEKGWVDDVIGSDEVEKGRPFPYMIEQLMFRAGVDDPMEVAKVGDTPVDIEEGKNAGCAYVVGVTWGAGKKEELEEKGATHIIDDLAGIPDILNDAAILSL